MIHHHNQSPQGGCHRNHSINNSYDTKRRKFFCFVLCQQQPSPTQISIMILLPLLCTIICVSIINSQHSIDTILQWQHVTITYSPKSIQQRTMSGDGDNDQQRLRLRYNYTNLQRYSRLANDIAYMQSNYNCSTASTSSIPGYFWYRNRYGLGSDLHVYSVAICNALQMNYNNRKNKQRIHVQTLLPWIWYDQDRCSHDSSSAMTCYFPESEPTCPTLNNNIQQQSLPTTTSSSKSSFNLTRPHGKIKESCLDVISIYGNGMVNNIRTATIEFLFTRVSPTLQEEGERQLYRLFSKYPTATIPPKNLITVHIRWGDKVDEMELAPISKYINAVYEILEQRRQRQQQRKAYMESNNTNDDDDTVHIYLATEDPEALHQFQAAVPSQWHIYVDQFFIEYLPYRKPSNIYNGIPQMAYELLGRPGLTALGSLLVAMEANDYILTTSSNWSRLMNEIRISIINPRCNNCTTMIDLKPGEW